MLHGVLEYLHNIEVIRRTKKNNWAQQIHGEDSNILLFEHVRAIMRAIEKNFEKRKVCT